ncbi:MAG: hypothetical protein AAGC95_12395 [Pseudomonadota bacterium]
MDFLKVFYAFTLSLFLFAVPAYAGCDAKACTDKVENILVFNNDNVHVLMDNTAADRSNLNCTMAQNGSIHLPNANIGAVDRMYSALLSALMADKEITVRIQDGSNPCTVSYVRAIQG